MARTKGYVQLGSTILLHTPPEPEVGKLIVLCSWSGATGRLIHDCLSFHRMNTPNARVLLLTPSVKSMISSYSKQETALKPAEEVVCHILDECGYLNAGNNASKSSYTQPRILLHVMGNAGINSATNLLVVLQRKLKRSLPVAGLICDSVPTGASYMKLCRALTYSFRPDFPLNLTVWVFAHVVISLLYISVAIGRYEAPGEYWRKSILDQKLINCKKICYFVSKADKLTDWIDVLSHAEQARKKGWEVEEFPFDDTPHCRHFTRHLHRAVGGHFNVYNNVIANIWEDNKL
ncbi:indole-diterpene biosynthesis protein-like protein PaxU [Xylaria digitata]|nr:indole-diterpene biosynthesis protein-like protein PaxU [Xylaria digitata]